MNRDKTINANRAIETLSIRDGVSPEIIRGFIQEAILESQKNLTPKAEVLWKGMTPDGSLPSPDDLIVWLVQVVLG